ncbi:hypothetical protein [Parasphingopyxis marina]|uniref:Uncharacterized protein n=1 Tax=Parasphingopyxis marina TaxID=2761622 RepID=A0A842HTN2_9SPHN|nr:hypothetical protein [Parasphingopyxis marina]MBC2776382.1 hypothetical protein [Parasphingopyxis marina]
MTSAANRVGMSRESAYRLRARRGAAGFAAAWDAIMGAPAGEGMRGPRAKVTPAPLSQRLCADLYRPVLRGGRYVGTERKADISALCAALSRADRLTGDRPVRGDPGKGAAPQKGALVSTGPSAACRGTFVESRVTAGPRGATRRQPTIQGAARPEERSPASP